MSASGKFFFHLHFFLTISRDLKQIKSTWCWQKFFSDWVDKKFLKKFLFLIWLRKILPLFKIFPPKKILRMCNICKDTIKSHFLFFQLKKNYFSKKLQVFKTSSNSHFSNKKGMNFQLKLGHRFPSFFQSFQKYFSEKISRISSLLLLAILFHFLHCCFFFMILRQNMIIKSEKSSFQRFQMKGCFCKASKGLRIFQ